MKSGMGPVITSDRAVDKQLNQSRCCMYTEQEVYGLVEPDRM